VDERHRSPAISGTVEVMDEMTPYRPTVQSQADLEEVWRRLMGSHGFGGRSLWMLRIAPGGEVVPRVVQIAECDDGPDPTMTSGLAKVLASLDAEAPDGSWAFLVSRPGRGLHESDRMWARFVREAGAAGGVRLEITHLANDAGITPLPPDELIRQSA
jgi:hypothetical protein